MAKRRKVSGNPPRGLSKRDRQEAFQRTRGGLGGLAAGNRETFSTVKRVNADGTVEPHNSAAASNNPMSRPSSTRKKLVKEGNRKFIGPRQLRGMVREDVASRNEDLDYKRGKYEGDQLDYMINNLGAERSRQAPKLRAPELRRLSLDDYNPNAEEHSYGRGGIARNKRLKQLLLRLMDRHLGVGQEFDLPDEMMP